MENNASSNALERFATSALFSSQVTPAVCYDPAPNGESDGSH